MRCILIFLTLIGFAWRHRLQQLLSQWLVHLQLSRAPAQHRWFPRRRQSTALTATESSTIATPPAAIEHPRKKPAWVLREVLRLAVHLRTPRAIAHAFNRRHGQRMTVGKTWVHAQLVEHAPTITAMRREMKGAPPRDIPTGQEWGLDLTLVRHHGGTAPALGIVDHGARALLRLKALASKCTYRLLSQFFAACAEFGAPKSVRTDNEAMFTSRLWTWAFKLVGIKHQRSRQGCPWQNGRIERLFGTLKPLLRQLPLAPTAAALQLRLDEFTHFYNHVRVHQNLDGLTPAEAWSGKNADFVRRHSGRGQWVHALDGLLVGYWLRY